MFCFSFLFAETTCAQEGLAIRVPSLLPYAELTIVLLDILTPSLHPQSHFSLLSFFLSSQSVFLFVSRPKINIILCISLTTSLSGLLVYMSFFSHFFFSSQDYEILRWFQVNIKERTFYLLNGTHHFHITIYLPTFLRISF